MEGILIMDSIFKAYDIRGKVGSELTEEVCRRVGMALPDILNDGPIAVGRDMRADSGSLAEALIKGLREQGRDVYDLGEITTDMMYFAVGSLNLAGGAMITASHNPGEYNGIKLCREEARPIGIESGLADIRDAVMGEAPQPAATEGTYEQKDVMEAWVQHVLSFVKPSAWPAYKIAIDAGNGMAGKVIPHLEGKVPLQITPMYFELDGTFPNHLANPMDETTLVDLQKEIIANKLDFGIAFDADGDRARLLDENGVPLSGTVMTAILAKYFLLQNPGSTLLYNAICGRVVPELITEGEGKAIRTKVGHSYIKANMREEDAVFAGEHSGHYYFRDNYCADSGLIAAIIAIEVLAQSGKKLSELAAEFDIYAAMPEQNFEVENKEIVMEKVAKAFEDGDQDWLDGLTVNYEDAWFNVRPSNTEPLLRLNVEAKTPERRDELVAKVREVILDATN